MAEIEKEQLNESSHPTTTDSLRVKVFIYFADQWREKGIGFLGVTKIENDEKCYEIYDEHYKNGKVDDEKSEILPIYKLSVRSQQDTHERLISTYITSTVDYRVQEGSILTWKEGDYEKALSFECVEDCNKFMHIVTNIRQVIEGFDSTVETLLSNDSNPLPSSLIKNSDINKSTIQAADENDWNIVMESDEATRKDHAKKEPTKKDLTVKDMTEHTLKDVQKIKEEADDTLPNDHSSIWQEEDQPQLLPVLPEINADSLDDWLDVLCFTNNMNISNLFGGVEAGGDAPTCSRVSSFVLEDSNQLYHYMSTKNVLKEFFDIFHHHEIEAHNDLIVLFKLHQIFRAFISTDNFNIFRLMFEESTETLTNVIGVLEYDPTVDIRTSHRDYLKNKAKFRKFFLLDDSVTNEFPATTTTSPANSLTLKDSSVDVDNVTSTPTKNNHVGDNTNNETIESGDSGGDGGSDNNSKQQSTLEQICEKATLIYYIQYIIDHIMPTPSIFDDKLGPMTTYLNHHKADLCNLIYDNTMLLNSLFIFLTKGSSSKTPTNDVDEDIKIKSESPLGNAEDGDDLTKKPTLDDYIDSVSFLHEFCLLSNSLNPTDKDFFFRWLESYNLLEVLTRLMREPNVDVRVKVIDIIALLVDNKPAAIRAFNTAQVDKAIECGAIIATAYTTSNNNTTTTTQVDQAVECGTTIGATASNGDNMCLMDYLVATVIEFYDHSVSLHALNIINLLMDSDIMTNTDISYFEKMEMFCVQFFTYSFVKFLKPFINNFHSNSNGVVTSNDANASGDGNGEHILFDKLLSLLTRWIIGHHDYLIPIMVKENVMRYVTPLLNSTHKFVVCGVIRLIRKLLDLKDNAINEELVKYGSITRLMDDVFIGQQYHTCNNLVNNTIVEMFNFLLVEDIPEFYMPLVEKHRDLFNSIDYIDLFKRIVARHDVNVNKCEGGGVSLSLCTTTNSSEQRQSLPPPNNLNELLLYNSVRKRKSCEFENDEERWFNSDDINDDGDIIKDGDCDIIKDDGNGSADTATSDSALDDALNLFLYGDDDIAHASKKRKNSPIQLHMLKDPLTTSKSDEDDEHLFDVLVGGLSNHHKNKNSNDSNSNGVGIPPKDNLNKADDLDVLDTLTLTNHRPSTTPQLPPTKRQNLIKIHTNKFNSPRNLVIASSNSKSSNDEPSSPSSIDNDDGGGGDDDDGDSPVKFVISISDPDQNSTTPTSILDTINDNSLSNFQDNTHNCIVETTFEDDSDKSALNNLDDDDDQTHNNTP